MGWQSPRIKEVCEPSQFKCAILTDAVQENEEKVRVKKEVKEEDDINDNVDLRRWPPSKRHGRQGRYN